MAMRLNTLRTVSNTIMRANTRNMATWGTFDYQGIFFKKNLMLFFCIF